MKMTVNDIGVAVKYLQPMKTPTNIIVFAEDPTEGVDLLAQQFNDSLVASMAIGGESPALASEEFAEVFGGDNKVVIVKLDEGSPRSQAYLFEALICGKIDHEEVRNRETAIIVVVSSTSPIQLSQYVLNRAVTFEMV